LGAAAVHDAGDVGEAVTRTDRQNLVSALLGGVPDELGDRLTLGGRCPLQLLVELGIEAEASRAVLCITA
jgi:hypothetical protein